MKRRLDLGDCSVVPIKVDPSPPRPSRPVVQVERKVDLCGANQVLIYTRYLSRLFCPACEARGMVTSRVNPVTTLFVCQECLAMFEVEWNPRLQGTSIHVDQLRVCPDCNGRGDVIDGHLVESYCVKCSGYGRIKIPK